VSDPNTPADALTSEELDWIEQQVVIDARTVRRLVATARRGVALKSYARHRKGCRRMAVTPVCECGLSAILTPAQEATSKHE
jgi:hypothetical protein